MHFTLLNWNTVYPSCTFVLEWLIFCREKNTMMEMQLKILAQAPSNSHMHWPLGRRDFPLVKQQKSTTTGGIITGPVNHHSHNLDVPPSLTEEVCFSGLMLLCVTTEASVPKCGTYKKTSKFSFDHLYLRFVEVGSDGTSNHNNHFKAITVIYTGKVLLFLFLTIKS